MKPLSIGEVRVEAIVESAGHFMPFAEMIPGVTDEELARHRSWLEPRFADVGRRMGNLAFHSYLVRTPHHVILVDTCCGNDKDRNGYGPMHMLRTDWLARLRAAGVEPEQVDYVMCTHLHGDHVGWNTQLFDGRWIPTFPHAKYVFARKEYEHRARGHEKARAEGKPGNAAYVDSILPVMERNMALLVDGDWQLDRHVHFEPAEGHTPGNVVIHLQSRGERGICSGDVMHHPIQVVHPEWSAAFCEDPVKSAQCRRAFVERWADTPTTIMPAHFAAPTAGRIRRRAGEYRFEFLEG